MNCLRYSECRPARIVKIKKTLEELKNIFCYKKQKKTLTNSNSVAMFLNGSLEQCDHGHGWVRTGPMRSHGNLHSLVGFIHPQILTVNELVFACKRQKKFEINNFVRHMILFGE